MEALRVDNDIFFSMTWKFSLSRTRTPSSMVISAVERERSRKGKAADNSMVCKIGKKNYI